MKKKGVKLVYIKTEDQVDNIFTKPLKFDLLVKLKITLGTKDEQ